MQLSIPKKMLVFLVACLLAASWFSIGFFHPDEHYQIIEFASFLLGRSPADAMAWEFGGQIRPWLQPVLTAGPMWLGFLLTDSPYLVSSFLKICYGSLYLIALIWFVRSYYVYQQSQVKSGLGIEWNQYLFLMLLSPVVGLSLGRTSSESLGTVILLSILTIIYRFKARGTSLSHSMHFSLGCLIAVMFFVRFQMAFVYVALMAWFLLIERDSWRRLLSNVLGFLMISSVLVGLDSYFYGSFVVTPWEYFATNLIDGVAAGFGVSPWWYYFIGGDLSILGVFLRLSLWAWLLTFWGMRRSLIYWIVFFFVLGHSAIGHKEDRFLFPVIVFGPLFMMHFFSLSLAGGKFEKFVSKSSVRRGIVVLSVLFFLKEAVSIRHRDFFSLASIDLRTVIERTSTKGLNPPCVEWNTDRQYPMISKKLWSNFFRSPLMDVKDLTENRQETCTSDHFFAIVRQVQGQVFKSQMEDPKLRPISCHLLRADHQMMASLSQKGYLDWIPNKHLNGKEIALYECRQNGSI